ncbi:MAG: hypothetical protein H7Y38_12200 [Armatimonadetes bacterium]|nr:hypothetical protein [Armatimonadota bacterium]
MNTTNTDSTLISRSGTQLRVPMIRAVIGRGVFTSPAFRFASTTTA